ncbi:Protein NLRC3 [Symbiodinium microadriaticum]|uniref:Protein NLRC3 n=1 Tax=Symbiodinium microadriaticum TaxID=2951 RepID=A0A1Q9F0H9_SYMMI|nr:Protein NLRC3 [Symbiodinium microadriaticum]
MPPKKKPQKAEGEVDVFEEFMKKYNKNQREFEVPKIMRVQEIIQKMEEGEDMRCWNFDSEFDPMAFQVLCHTLRQAAYNDIEAIRLWKCGDGDKARREEPEHQAVRSVRRTEFEKCGLFGSGPNGNKLVNLLRLDYNQFGTVGVERLSQGLSQNATLRQLSLNYCGIGEDGGQYIAHILIYYRNALEKLELQGNYLKERGVVDVFNACRRKEALTEINVFDNKFSDTPEVIKALRELFASNVTLASYNLGGNHIGDEGASKLVHTLMSPGYSHVKEVKITERVATKTHEAISDKVGGGSKGGKKKGKKK